MEPLTGESRSKSRIRERLLAALRADGWSVESEVVGSHDLDVIARKGALAYVIEVKTARDGRSTGLTSLAAAGLLQARKYASLISATPMVVVGAPRLSASMALVLRRFLEEFGDGTPWGVVDEAGLLELHGPGLQGVKAVHVGQESRARLEASAGSQPRLELFSDLGQWCLKVLLSHLLPPELRIVSRGLQVGRPIRNASELAKIAGVSSPTAWRTVNALQKEGFLGQSEPLEPLRTDVLMPRWQAASLRHGPDIRGRWLFPSQSGSLGRLTSVLSEPCVPREGAPRRAIGLFAAADVLGQGFVQGVAPFLLHEDPELSELERLGLTAAGAGERVDVFVRRPRFPEAVFRGAAMVHGVPVADVLQIWLDVSTYPARGAEMAEHLGRRVLSRLVAPLDTGLLADEETP